MNTQQVYSNGGTNKINIFSFNDIPREIAIESISMLGQIVFTHNPKTKLNPHPEVLASLERSMKENADTWQELSKY